MKVKLYLHPEAIRFNPDMESKADYISKFSLLLRDLIDITNSTVEEVSMVCHTKIYTAEIFDKKKIFEFVDSEFNDNEVMPLLMQILGKGSNMSDCTIAEVEKLSEYKKDEDAVHALVVMNRPKQKDPEENVIRDYMQFDRYELIYDRNSWLTLRRQMLGNHPGDADNFIKKAKLNFPDLIFSEECGYNGIEEYLESVPRKIVYYLSCINDKFLEFRSSNEADIWDAIDDFCGRYKFDRTGSPQGKPKDKDKFTFTFKDKTENESGIKEEKIVRIVCRPHFKITKVDDNYDGEIGGKGRDSYARIYFCHVDKRIYIGSVGPHL